MALNHPQSPTKILAELQSIRDLLDEKYFEPPLQPHVINPEAIPLLADVVELAAPTISDATAQTPAEAALPEPLPPSLEVTLHQEAEHLMQEVISSFLPQIEAELKRRLAQKLDDLLKPQ